MSVTWAFFPGGRKGSSDERAVEDVGDVRAKTLDIILLKLREDEILSTLFVGKSLLR